jgi:hypothetical protein
MMLHCSSEADTRTCLRAESRHIRRPTRTGVPYSES